MKMRHLTVMAYVLACFASYAWAGGDLWMTDLEAAKTKAAKENKYLLVDFTGSDWCIWCKRLNGEVFSTEPFQNEAPKQFVLVEVDFPRDKSKLTAEQQKTNNQLAQRYGIRGFPTVLLMDAKGAVFARTGYKRGGGEAYLAHLNDLLQAQKKFEQMLAKAQKAKGPQKAKLLDQAMETRGEDGVTQYPKLVDQIIALDADNALGLKNKYLCRRAIVELDNLPRATTPAERIAKIDAILKQYKPTGAGLQRLLFVKGLMTMFSGDAAKGDAILQQAIQADPQSEHVARIQQLRKSMQQRLKAAQQKAKTQPDNKTN